MQFVAKKGNGRYRYSHATNLKKFAPGPVLGDEKERGGGPTPFGRGLKTREFFYLNRL
jgi:hypothetical protein